MREDRLSAAALSQHHVVTATVRQAASAADIALARTLMLEYADSLNVDLCFQDFASELAGLPGAYAPPRGRLLLAGMPGAAFGCIALRPLAGWPDESLAPTPVGEVKRLYVQPEQRAGHWGRRLSEALIADAQAIGFRELKLDTLARMTAARALYAQLGFRECAAYYVNPLPEVVYMSLTLPAFEPAPRREPAASRPCS
ncbi:MAG: GNAT family N-acetyltransferase [Casimicrobiaceae bacterium]